MKKETDSDEDRKLRELKALRTWARLKYLRRLSTDQARMQDSERHVRFKG